MRSIEANETSERKPRSEGEARRTGGGVNTRIQGIRSGNDREQGASRVRREEQSRIHSIRRCDDSRAEGWRPCEQRGGRDGYSMSPRVAASLSEGHCMELFVAYRWLRCRSTCITTWSSACNAYSSEALRFRILCILHPRPSPLTGHATDTRPTNYEYYVFFILGLRIYRFDLALSLFPCC